MQNWTCWIPFLRSWVNAIALILLMASLHHIPAYLWWIISWLITTFPKLIYVFYVLITFSPILLIALLHHWLHQLLDQFFPESRLSNTAPVEGAFPGLVSWREGLYGWLVNQLSATLSWAILGIFLPMSNNTAVLQFSPWSLSNFLTQIPSLSIATLIIQIIFAAFFYQFEYAVQRHFAGAEYRE